MARVYKSVRLSHEAKVWIDNLIEYRTKLLKQSMKDGLVYNLENELCKKEELNGVSVNIVLNVTIGSVIEQAYRETKNFSNEKWHEVIEQMEVAKKNIESRNVESVTPRLFINEDILEGLDDLRIKLRREGHGIPRLSFVIKIVIFAMYSTIPHPTKE